MSSSSPAADPGPSATAGPRVGLRGLLSDSAVFGFGGTLGGLLGVVTFPVMARYLGPEDFGVLSLYQATLAVFSIAAACGLPHAFFRFYTERTDPDWAARALSAVFWAMAGIGVPVVLAVLALRGPLNRLVMGETSADFVTPMCMAAILSGFLTLASSRMQADGRKRAYLGMTAAHVLGARLLPLVLVVLGYGVLGAVWGEAGSLALTALGAGLYAFRDLRLRPDRAMLREVLGFGGALTPGMLSTWLLRGADKYMLRLLLADPLRQVGYYGVAARVSSALNLVGQGAVLGWRRFAFQNMHDDASKPLLARGATILLVGIGYCALVLATLGEDAVYWLVGPRFMAATAAIPLLVAATMLGETQAILRIGLLKEKRTGVVSLLVTAAAAGNILLNYLAIPRFGLAGAAASTLVSQLLLVVAAQYLSQRMFRVPFEWGRMARATALFLAVFFAGVYAAPEGPIAGAAARISLLALTPPALFVIGFFRPDERQFLRTLLQRVPSRRVAE